jgi:hypothetical protein
MLINGHQDDDNEAMPPETALEIPFQQRGWSQRVWKWSSHCQISVNKGAKIGIEDFCTTVARRSLWETSVPVAAGCRASPNTVQCRGLCDLCLT